MNNLQKARSCLIILALLAGCTNLSAVYSEQAYRQAVTLKVESLLLMEKAVEPFSEHDEEVFRLKKRLQIAYQYALGRPNNEITAEMWEILISPERNLLGGFLERWKAKGTLPEVFIEENQKLIADAFNTIIELESGKIKPSKAE